MNKKRDKSLQVLIEKLIRVTHNMHSGQSFPFGDFMLSRPQIMMLFFIYENKGLASVKDISKFLHVTPGAVTQFVDSLVDKKFVKREENSQDRRSVHIKLMPATEKRFNSFKKKYLVNARTFFTELNDEDINKFIQLLEKIKTPLCQ